MKSDREILIDIQVDVRMLRNEWQAFELVRELVQIADAGTILDLGKGCYPVSPIVKRMRELVRGSE